MLKLMVRELFRNWFQYLSMFVITALAVTLFLGFISNTQTLRVRSERYLDESNLADLIVQVTTFEEGDEEYLAGLDTERLEYRVYSDGEFSRLGDAGVHNIAKIFVADGEINKPYIVEGQRGFLIDKTVANLYGYGVGDSLTVEFTAFKEFAEQISEEVTAQFAAYGEQYGAFVPELKDIKVTVPSSYTFTVTGLMHSVEGVNIYSNSPVFLATDTVAQTIAEEVISQLPMENGLFKSIVTEEKVLARVKEILSMCRNQALISSENFAEQKEEIRDRFADAGNGNLLFVYDRDTMESVVILDNEVEQSKNMLYIFPVIFFLVSILVIMTSISRLILRERINIGTLKALGMTNGRIVFHYAFMSAAVTFFGCVLGAIIGPLIVPAVMTVKYGLIFSMPKIVGTVYSMPWTFGLTAIVCILALLIGVWAARSVMKENPAECMRPKQITYTPKVMRGTGRSKESRHLLLSCRMALRNIRINWGRSLMTVIGVMGCAALLVTSFGIGDTMTNSVENDYGVLCYYDVTSPYAAAQEEEFFSLLEKMKGEGTIETYERVRTYVATAHTGTQSKDITVYVLPENSQMSAITRGGSTLSRITADVLKIGEGEDLSFTLGACTADYSVEDVVETSTWNGFFTTVNHFSEDCYFQENVWVKTASPDEVRDQLNEINGTGTAKTMGDRRAEIENLISSTNAMKYTLMVFAILLSVVVLYNLSLLNVKERTRDMATLKVLGFTHFQVSFALIVEIMLLTLIGTACGAFLGYPLMYLVMKLNEMATMAFVYAITPLSYVLSVAVALGTAIFINFIFGLSISRISMTESLKSVE